LALPDDLVARLDSTDWHVRRNAVAELAKLAKQTNDAPGEEGRTGPRELSDVDVREEWSSDATARHCAGRGSEPFPRPTSQSPSRSPRCSLCHRALDPLPALDDWQTRFVKRRDDGG
jgi:hypothetical protein